ncbi:MAG: hypothetical protein EOM48_09210 [Bacilli bacterium]|nr:hypothetical protein [Bacilli bacterium]
MKPTAVPKATATAMPGEKNIAIIVATWLAKVKDAGSRIIFKGEIIGIRIPIAISRAAIVMCFVCVRVFIWPIPPKMFTTVLTVVIYYIIFSGVVKLILR